MPSCQKLATMAEIFLDSAVVLLEKDKVRFYFVILYLLGTSIELYLKAIITSHGKKAKFIHDLSCLAKAANVDMPDFLKTLTYYLLWKSKYHETCESKYERDFYEENNVATSFYEIIDYIKKLGYEYKNN